MKTPNPDHPIRNTLTHLALGAALGITLLAPASATPPVTSGLTLHLDASAITPVLTDGDTVNTWNDVSGLANDATLSAGTPIYKTGILNGQPVVRFDDNSTLTTADLSSQFPTAATVFIATTINDNQYTLLRATPNNDEFWRFAFGGSYQATFRTSRLENYGTIPVTGSHLFAITSSASAWEMSINGTSQGDVGGNYNSGGALVVGGGNNANLNGDIAEILIYNRVLSFSENNQVGVYLSTKYGLSTIYGPPTVVSFTPPDGGTTATDSNLVVTFNKPVAIGSGNITIKNLTDSTQTAIPVADPQVTLSGAVLTINPDDELLAGNNYAVQIDNGAIDTFAGILDDTTWNFTAAAATPTTIAVVTSGSPSIYGDSVTFTATVTPVPSGGTVQFYNGVPALGSPVPVIGGVATFTTSSLGVVGPNDITAEYSGNFQFAGSESAPTTQVVDQAELTVTAQNVFRFLDTANPDPLPFAITGFKNGENLGSSGVSGTPVLSTTAPPSPVGDYPITCTVGDLAAPNYSFTAVNATLSVLPASAAPPVTTDLKLHLNASQLTGLSDGDTLTHWADMSGMFNNATTSAGTPIYKTNALNGQPVVRFDDSSALTTADLSAQFPTAATMFIVTTINDGEYTLVKATPVGGEFWRFGFTQQSFPAAFRSSRLEAYSIMPDTGSHIFAISSSASAWSMARNGVSGTVAGGDYNAGGALVIGNGTTGGGLNGDIAEVLVYSRVLSSQELNAVGYYLETKYGIDSAYQGPGGFGAWADANGATGQTPEQDHDFDGVSNGIEFFMGETGSSFTATPSLNAANEISWPASAAYVGTYEVQTSPDLGTWTNVDPRPAIVSGFLNYTLPTGAPGGKSFVRLFVTPTP